MDLKTREKFIKTVIWIIVVAFVTTIFATWGAHYNQQQQNDPVAMEVDGIEITKIDYFNTYNKRLEDAKKYYDTELSDTVVLEIRNSVVDEMIQNILLKKLAEKYNTTPTLKDIQSGVARYFIDDKRQFNAQAFEYYKKNQSAAWWERLEKAASEEILISKAELLLTDKVKVSDDEIKLYFSASSVQAKVQQIFLNPSLLIDTPTAEKYYNENKESYIKPEKRFVRHIIISETDLT
ncbi:SurA N-terminal domain-containing protein, partial [Candidatus Dependentiae bacterium]|nr:SurA N-terminal domain-containing protein [Candidatus Dependentiae bacterium]